jgi:hypothetical protein
VGPPLRVKKKKGGRSGRELHFSAPS